MDSYIYSVITTFDMNEQFVEHQAVIQPSEMIFDPNAIPCDALGNTWEARWDSNVEGAIQISITRFRLE